MTFVVGKDFFYIFFEFGYVPNDEAPYFFLSCL